MNYSRLRERVENEARYIIEHDASLREAARALGLSKSTIHKDMKRFLPTDNPECAKQVDTILKRHWKEKHLKGGKATQKKYETLRKQKNP